jgi:hypothetical protein
LLETQHKVAGLEGPSAYPFAVVIAEVLLINCRSDEGYVLCFVQQVAGIFQRYLCVFFDIGLDTRHDISHISRKHRFCPEQQEERCVAG